MSQAMLLEGLGRYLEAKPKYEDVLKIDPEEGLALNNLAYLLIEHLDNPAEALPYARQAQRLTPTDPGVLDTLGWILAKANRLGEAAGRLLRALEIERERSSQEHVAASYHLGVVHMLRGELEEAKDRLDSAKAAAEDQKDQQFKPKIEKALEDLEELGG